MDWSISRRGLPAAFAAALLLSKAPASGALERTIRVPQDHPTIVAAMEAAAFGDTVLVAPGTYTEVVTVKDGVRLCSEQGPSQTTLAFKASASETENPGEAVVSFGRCTSSTQIVGFAIDGGGKAKRAVVAIGDARPVIESCRIYGAVNGVGAHRNAAPYVLRTRIEKSQIAAVFIQGGSADIRHCELVDGDMYGLLVEGTTRPVTVSSTAIRGNVQAGVRAIDGELTIRGGHVSGNGNTGIVIDYVSPLLDGIVVEGNKNIGVLLQNSTGTMQGCTIRGNDFGVVCAGAGTPTLFRNIFENNASYHIGIQGEAVPLISGAVDKANLFLKVTGENGVVIQTESPVPVNATFNYWGKTCPTRDQVKRIPGAKDVIRRPWVIADLKHYTQSCEEARRLSQAPIAERDAILSTSEEAQ